MVIQKKLRGFTLIELLVTISIIAILSAIGLIAYSNVSKQGRDSKRQSDLRTIQSALEQYFADQFYYPVNNTSSSCSEGLFKVDCSLTDPNERGITYINKIPKDPKSPPEYCYVAKPDSCNNDTDKCSSYELYTKLESQTGTSTIVCSASYNYKLTPP